MLNSGEKDGAELMRTVTAAFAKSDLQPLLDALHEDVVWKTASRQERVFRFEGDYKSRAGVVDVLSKISMDYTFHYLRPKEVVTSGDVVWGMFEAGLAFDPKGQEKTPVTINLEMAIRWRLKDGKIIEHQAFFDTASLLLKQMAQAS